MKDTAYIYGAIFSLSNRLQISRDKFDPNVSTKQWFVLANIALFEGGKPNIGDIAHRIGTSRQNIKKIALILEKKDYIALKKDTTDSRFIRIVLTTEGKAYYEKRAEQEAYYLKQLFEDFDKDVLTGLYSGLCKLMKKVIQMENNNPSFDDKDI